MSLTLLFLNSSPAAFVLSDSTNIAASGAATTAQLTAPSGKTSGANFQAGRIQDDENPTDAIDLAADKYTEIEFSLKAVSGVVTVSDVYEFRLIEAATNAVLTTYTVTPQGTIESAGVSGSLSQTLGTLTLSSAGAVDIAGQAVPTLAVLTLTAPGTVDIAGVSAVTLDALTLSSAGTVAWPELVGDLTQTLGALTLDSQGVVGDAPLEGVLVQTLGDLTLASAGTVEIAGDLSQPLAALTLAAPGTVEIQGTSAPTLAALTLSSAGTVEIAGVSTPTLDALTTTATGTVDIAGMFSQPLGALALSGEGIVGDPPREGELVQTLGILTAVSTGTVEISGVAVPTFAALTVASTGTVEIAGTASITLGALLPEAAVGVVQIAGVLGTYEAMVVADGASHYWKLDDSASPATDSITNDPSYSLFGQEFPSGIIFGVASPINQRTAAHFDGVDRLARSVVVAPSPATFSVEAWFKPDTVDVSGGNRAVVYTDNDNTLYFGANVIGWKLRIGGVLIDLTTPVTMVAGQTYHVVGSYDGATYRLYTNGVFGGSVPATGTVNYGTRFVIGAPETINYQGFIGTIDEVATYPLALSAAQIAAHKTTGSPVLPIGDVVSVATGQVEIAGVATITLGALGVIPEVAWQPIARPGSSAYGVAFIGGSVTSSTITTSTTETEIRELVEV